MSKKIAQMPPAEYGAWKRAWECYSADPAWREGFLADPARQLASFPEISDVYAAFKAIGMVRRETASDRSNPYYDEFMRRYEAVGAVLEEGFREERFADKRLFRWNRLTLRRARVEKREMIMVEHIRYFPLMFELSDGCREQCPFCGLSAPPHRGDFLATPENRGLWREVLAASREMLGDVAGEGCCYLATEPLNNPDYEKLLADFHDLLGRYPQTTTVLAAKHPARIRALMAQMGRERMGLAAMRFSVRSLSEFHRIMAEYTPEELADVELLLNHVESDAAYSDSGRARGMDLPPEKMRHCYSISCVAGFRVNMARRSVAFMEPELPSDACPTGVRTHAEERFADAGEYRCILRDFSDRFARDVLPEDTPFRLTSGVTVEERKDMLVFRGDVVSLRLGGNVHFREAVRRLAKGAATLPEIFRELGIGAFVGADVRQKLNLLYQKGYLQLL